MCHHETKLFIEHYIPLSGKPGRNYWKEWKNGKKVKKKNFSQLNFSKFIFGTVPHENEKKISKNPIYHCVAQQSEQLWPIYY